MLTIYCATCKSKLWRYDKIGSGHVVRCHKKRIARWFMEEPEAGKLLCTCGKPIGIDKGSHYRMISGAFTHRGTKRGR